MYLGVDVESYRMFTDNIQHGKNKNKTFLNVNSAEKLNYSQRTTTVVVFLVTFIYLKNKIKKDLFLYLSLHLVNKDFNV